MKLIKIIGLASFFTVLCLHADKPDADKFFYDQGFNDGKIEGIRLGYKKAEKELLKKLKSRIDAIKAMEAGKYLSRKHKITAPQIYQVRKPDGSLSIQVRGCRLEGELTPEEIMLLPKSSSPYSQSTQEARGGVSESSSSKNGAGMSNGVFLPGIDTAQYDKPTMAVNVTDTVYKYLPNTDFYVNELRISGFPFTVTNGGVNLKVRFSSEQEAVIFMRRYGLEPGRDLH